MTHTHMHIYILYIIIIIITIIYIYICVRVHTIEKATKPLKQLAKHIYFRIYKIIPNKNH